VDASCLEGVDDLLTLSDFNEGALPLATQTTLSDFNEGALALATQTALPTSTLATQTARGCLQPAAPDAAPPRGPTPSALHTQSARGESPRVFDRGATPAVHHDYRKTSTALKTYPNPHERKQHQLKKTTVQQQYPNTPIPISRRFASVLGLFRGLGNYIGRSHGRRPANEKPTAVLRTSPFPARI